jgi:diaminopimelate epimerase
MTLRFTKMQGAGNDFVVLDATQTPLALSRDQLRRLGDRRFGVGADQILVVERSTLPGVDFRYRIFNNTGDEVENCGNGARCFVRYVHDKGLSDKTTLHVETINSRLTLVLQDDGRVTVDMNVPTFDLARVPFDAQGLQPRAVAHAELWPVPVGGQVLELAVLSMGNPHAVCVVPNVDTAPVLTVGPLIESHARFTRKVNVGFMQVLSRRQVRLRVFERDAGETLACGTGACAAVVAGIQQGLLDERVDVQARGGLLTIAWSGPNTSVFLTGPAETVFEGEIAL